jgi:tRNA (adenine22-N1)-methyltransferase
MPKLDARLHQLLAWISPHHHHADIGCDHAHLAIALAERDGCSNTSHHHRRIIAIDISQAALRGAEANILAHKLPPACIELRLGDGFAAVGEDKVDSASLSGMGGATMVNILQQAQDNAYTVPHELLLVPNSHQLELRQWCFEHRYWLIDEALLPGFWLYPALHLRRATQPGPDPQYAEVPPQYGHLLTPPQWYALAVRFGPHLLRTQHPSLLHYLQVEQQRLQLLASHQPRHATALAWVNLALSVFV